MAACGLSPRHNVQIYCPVVLCGTGFLVLCGNLDKGYLEQSEPRFLLQTPFQPKTAHACSVLQCVLHPMYLRSYRLYIRSP